MKLLFIFLLFFCLFIQNSKEILSEKERSVKLEKFKDKTLISESNYNQGLLERHSSKASTLNKSNKPLKFLLKIFTHLSGKQAGKQGCSDRISTFVWNFTA